MELMKLANRYMDNKKALFGLVGNKTDLYHLHAVKMAEHAQVFIYFIIIFCFKIMDFFKLSENNKMKSFFMSAKTGDQINDCFISIAGELSGVNTNVKTSSIGGQALSNQQNMANENIEEDEDDDEEDSEDDKKKKKNPPPPPVSEKKLKNNQPPSKTNLNIKEEKEKNSKDGFNLTQADMKKMQMSGPKKTKNCQIF